MANIKEYNYYDVTPTQEVGPPKRPIPWRFILWGIASILAIIVLVIVASAVIRGGSQGQVMDRAESEIESCEGNQDCAANEIARLIAETGSAEACAALEGNARIECVTAKAVTDANPDICLDLARSNRQSCLDAANLELAATNLDATVCLSIESNDLKELCGSSVASRIAESGNCDNTGEWRSVCEESLILAVVPFATDPDICTTFAEGDSRDACFDLLSSLDQDDDGLSLEAELQAGTSDMNPDTDGDGFSDAIELETGNNPLGA